MKKRINLLYNKITFANEVIQMKDLLELVKLILILKILTYVEKELEKYREFALPCIFYWLLMKKLIRIHLLKLFNTIYFMICQILFIYSLLYIFLNICFLFFFCCYIFIFQSLLSILLSL